MEAVKGEEGDAALMQRASEGTYAKVRFSPSGLVALWPFYHSDPRTLSPLPDVVKKSRD
jgi:hypothetical protein